MSSEETLLSDEVSRMARMMQRRLDDHASECGDSWKGESVDWLMCRLYDEVYELGANARKKEASVAEEAADVANFAMFIAEVVLEQRKPDTFIKPGPEEPEGTKMYVGGKQVFPDVGTDPVESAEDSTGEDSAESDAKSGFDETRKAADDLAEKIEKADAALSEEDVAESSRNEGEFVPVVGGVVERSELARVLVRAVHEAKDFGEAFDEVRKLLGPDLGRLAALLVSEDVAETGGTEQVSRSEADSGGESEAESKPGWTVVAERRCDCGNVKADFGYCPVSIGDDVHRVGGIGCTGKGETVLPEPLLCFAALCDAQATEVSVCGDKQVAHCAAHRKLAQEVLWKEGGDVMESSRIELKAGAWPEMREGVWSKAKVTKRE